MAKIMNLFANTRMKNMAIVVVIVVIAIAIVAFFLIHRGSDLGTGEAKVSKVPTSIEFVPGTKDLPKEYLKTLLKSERMSAKSALKTGESAVPSMLAMDQSGDVASASLQTTQKQKIAECCRYMEECCRKGSNVADLLNQWVQQGKVSPVSAAEISKLAADKTDVTTYATGLNRLVNAGKLTPNQARELLNAYRQERAVTTRLPTANNLVDQMLSEGQLSPDIANHLKQISADGKSVSAYRTRLNGLMREGKITPEQARQLLTAYRQEHQVVSGISTTANDLVDQMVSEGAVGPQVGSMVRQLSTTGKSVGAYQSNLNHLVSEGQLTSGAARRLLNAYRQEHGEILSRTSSDDLVTKMQNAGQLSSEDASKLKQLSDSNVPVNVYKTSLDRMVNAGKLTSAQAGKLNDAYDAEHVGATPRSQKTSDLVDQMVKSGLLSSQDGDTLKQLSTTGAPVSAYQMSLDRMVRRGELNSQKARQLLSVYRQKRGVSSVVPTSTKSLVSQMASEGKISPNIASQLSQLSESGESAVDYAKNLNQLVRARKLSSSVAQKLLAAYEKENPNAGIPQGAGEIAQLERVQQRRELTRQKQELQQQHRVVQQQQQKQKASTRQAALKSLMSSMKSQAHSFVSAWRPVHQEVKRTHESSEKKVTHKTGEHRNGELGSDGGSQMPLIKAGTIMFAVLDTGVNSDRAGPIMASIVSGKLKGAKLMGGLSVTSDHERVVLKFTSLTMPDWPDVVKINAVAINPDTAHTAIASSVDHHYLLRYGSVFASNFLSGVADAIKSSGSTTVQDSGSSKTTHEKLNTANKLLVGIGAVGEKLSDVTKDIFNKKPTVKVNAGVGLGILFTSGVA